MSQWAQLVHRRLHRVSLTQQLRAKASSERRKRTGHATREDQSSPTSLSATRDRASTARAAKTLTLDDYGNMVLGLDRALGHMPLEQVTLDVLERWRAALIVVRSPSSRTATSA
jgi:hypothetical protein